MRRDGEKTNVGETREDRRGVTDIIGKLASTSLAVLPERAADHGNAFLHASAVTEMPCCVPELVILKYDVRNRPTGVISCFLNSCGMLMPYPAPF